MTNTDRLRSYKGIDISVIHIEEESSAYSCKCVSWFSHPLPPFFLSFCQGKALFHSSNEKIKIFYTAFYENKNILVADNKWNKYNILYYDRNIFILDRSDSMNHRNNIFHPPRHPKNKIFLSFGKLDAGPYFGRRLSLIDTVPFAVAGQRQSQTACNRDRVSPLAVLSVCPRHFVRCQRIPATTAIFEFLRAALAPD